MGMHVQEVGPAGAPTIVLLHGAGVGGWMWRDTIVALSEIHLLIPDMPEQGKSQDAGLFSIAGTARLVADLIAERAHGGKAFVAGLSLGAQVTVALLGSQPDVVLGAFASGTLVRPIAGIGLVNAMLPLYMPMRNARWLVRANMKTLEVPDKFESDFARETAALTTASYRRLTIENATFRVPPGLGSVTCPVLITVGEREMKVMKESAHDLVAATPSARAFIVAGHGHNWPVQDPDLYAQVVRAWMANGPLPGKLRPL
jgi:pimeloyl-ACP methyl ester carboxylesterase